MSNEWNGNENEEEIGEQDYAFQTLNRYGRPKTLGWSLASLLTGLAALFTCGYGISGIILGAMAIIFSILSRRILGYFDGKSIFGLILGIFGAVFGAAMIIFIYSLGSEEKKYLWDFIREVISESEYSGASEGLT